MGRIDIPLKEIRSFIDSCCFDCMDLTSEWADLSVGMFEGRPDWNTLIIRSEKGEDVVQNAVTTGYLIIENMSKENLYHLKKAARKKKERALRVLKKQNSLSSPSKGGCSSFIIPEKLAKDLLK